MARVALAHAGGIALPLLGVVPNPTFSLIGALAALILLFLRPWPWGVLVAALGAGVLSGTAVERAERRDCRLHLPRRWEQVVEGQFLTRPVPGASLPFELRANAPGGCAATVRAVAAAGAELPNAGEKIRVLAHWEGRVFPQPGWGERAGLLRLGRDWEYVGSSSPGGLLLELRGRVQHRVAELWGASLAPAVEALVLARREHLDPELREAFALSGTAHLLAISGFHVGVVFAMLVGALRLLGCRGIRAELGGVLGCWAYVMGIGAPHAAVRAGSLLSLLLVARLRGQPVMATGALGAALVILLTAQPSWLASVGFQLSFTATAGLVLLRESVSRGLAIATGWISGVTITGRGARSLHARLLRGGTDGVAAGVAATALSLPLLAWHFDRISLVGIPATLLIAPLIAIVIPGIGFSLLLSLLPGGLGAFLAGGTGLLLNAILRLVTWTASAPGASAWVSREALVGTLLAGTATWFGLRLTRSGRVRRPIRAFATLLVGAAATILLPALPLHHTLELHLIDVGQGDAIALEFPSGRWVLVDAGPRSPRFDAGARRVVPYLRRNGGAELDALVLTHPHLDHIGGAPAVLSELDVRGVLDPSSPTPSRGYLELLERARDSGIAWWVARAGMGFELEGAHILVLHPDSAPTLAQDDPNDRSVVLLVRWGAAALLLMGDAPAGVERSLLDRLPHLTVLKVGHHGSRTSTSRELLDRTRPEIALVPVGDGNRFGHPDPVIIDRLESREVTVYRTDRDHDLRLTIGRDGEVKARSLR